MVYNRATRADTEGKEKGPYGIQGKAGGDKKENEIARTGKESHFYGSSICNSVYACPAARGPRRISDLMQYIAWSLGVPTPERCPALIQKHRDIPAMAAVSHLALYLQSLDITTLINHAITPQGFQPYDNAQGLIK